MAPLSRFSFPLFGGEEDVRHGGRARALRPILAMAALVALLGGCCCGPRYYGDTGRDHYGPRVGPNARPSAWEYERAITGSLRNRRNW